MARLPIPGGDDDVWGTVLNDYLSVSLDPDGTLKPSAVPSATSSAPGKIQLAGDINGAATSPQITSTHLSSALPLNQGGTGSTSQNFVDLTTNQSIAGVKSFTGEVIVPTPTNGGDAATKLYVDSSVSAGAPDASPTTKGIVQLTNDFGGTATAPAVTSTHLSSALPVNQGGTGSTSQNFVDLTTAQTIQGQKTLLTTGGTWVSGSTAQLNLGDSSTYLQNQWGGSATLFSNNTLVLETTNSKDIVLNPSSNTVSVTGSLSISDGQNIQLGTTSGTMIGTSGTQKIALYGATPITQPSGDVLTALSNLGLITSPTLSAGDIPSMSGTYVDLTTAQSITGAKTFNAGALLDKGSAIYNVKAFGAKGDGATDDKTSIQNAITAAASGGVVYFPVGTYIISSALKFNSGHLTLRGAGWQQSIIKASASFSGFGLIYDFTSGLSDCGIEGLTFDSNGLANVSSVQLGTCSNISIRFCEFTNKTSNGWSVLIGTITDDGTYGASSASSHIVFTDNWIHDNANGTNETVLPVNCRFSRFDNNYFANNTNSAYSLNLYGYCNSSSANNNVFNNTSNAIFILSCQNVTVNRNVVQAGAVGQSGISVANSHQVTVEDNTIQLYQSSGSAGSGILLFCYGGTFDGHTSLFTQNQFVNIQGNIVSAGYNGINIGSSANFALNSDIQVLGNTIQNTIDASIIAGKNSSDSQITNLVIAHNVCQNSQVFGARGVIQIAGYASNVAYTTARLIQNKVYPTTNGSVLGGHDTACGIHVDAATVVINDNDLTGTGQGIAEIYLINSAVITQQFNNLGSTTTTEASSLPGNLTINGSYSGSGSGLTGIPESSITGLSTDLAAKSGKGFAIAMSVALG